MKATKFNSNKFHEALSLQQYGCYDQAEKKYQEVLQTGENAEVLRNLAVLYGSMERHQDAVSVLYKSVKLEPSAVQYYSLAMALEAAGEDDEAVEAYQEALNIDPDWMEARNNLGNLLVERGEIEEATREYRAAIQINPEHTGGYLNLGNLLLEQGRTDEALTNYLHAICLNPHDQNVLYNLGVAFEVKGLERQASLYYGYSCYYSGEYTEAIKFFKDFLTTEKGDAALYAALAICHEMQNDYEGTIATYKAGIKTDPKNDELYFLLALALQETGETKEAIRVATEASKLLPESITLRLQKNRILPIIYDYPEEIDYYRERFIGGLREAIEQTDLSTEGGRQLALKGVGTYTNFYLQYQGRDDINLQKEYGDYLCRVMRANYPQWSVPLKMPPLGKNGKIRIGYCSFHMYSHSGARWALGWLKNHDRSKFKLYCYQLGEFQDRVTQQFKAVSDHFHQLPKNIETVCNQIRSDDLHILIFPDIGMVAMMSQLCALRLAPIQCTAWGHPITSGLPTIDYYLSSELMEPENADEHYSEKLVRLPNTGLCYSKPVLPEMKKTRSDYDLYEDAVVYLSCQSLFKYLPQHDYIYPEIARRVPNAQFTFLKHHQSRFLTEKFRQRLKRAFAKYGLNSEDYCVLIDRQNSAGFLNMNMAADIFLDTFIWSGGNTTFDAVACGLPVVTCPGEFMRGRHSYSILKTLGITKTIAESEADYINIAVNLGTNDCWRKDLSRQMLINDHLYEDRACVESLDQFFIDCFERGKEVVEP